MNTKGIIKEYKKSDNEFEIEKIIYKYTRICI